MKVRIQKLQFQEEFEKFLGKTSVKSFLKRTIISENKP